MMRLITLFLLWVSATGLFLRSNRPQQHEDLLTIDEQEELRHLWGCPASETCYPISDFPDAMEDAMECSGTSEDGCYLGCRYHQGQFKCGEDIAAVDHVAYCNYPCVYDDTQQDNTPQNRSPQSTIPADTFIYCDDFRSQGVFLSALPATADTTECTGVDDCPEGECRWKSDVNETQCDLPDGSLCGNDWVDDDTSIPEVWVDDDNVTEIP